MREIDEVRITLLRLFRKGAPGTAVAHHTPTHSLYGENEGLWPPNTIDFQLWPMVPQVIIKLINGILRGRPVDSHQERVHASIKLQAYGRGLLQRFRSHRLITKDFNRQASREYQKYLKLFGVISTGITSSHTREPSRFARTFALYHHKRITEDYQGIRAKWYTREHRESRKALAYRIRRAHRVVGRADQEHSCWIQNRNILASLPGGEVVYYRLATTLIQHLGGLWAHNNLLST